MSLTLSTLFKTCDWNSVPEEEHLGITGSAFWKTQLYGDVRVRVVRYTPGYLSDHWCTRGHLLLVLEGTLETEVKGMPSATLRPGHMYVVDDGASEHRSRTRTGATLFIVD